MRVLIPSPLRSYTHDQTEVEAGGATLAELLEQLERRFPGIRFRMVDEQDRIRPHIWFFIGERLAREITEPLAPATEVRIVCALSGG